MNNAVSFRNVTMRFGEVTANDNVSLDIRRGEIFALVGENGAGKSTLMNVLYGIHKPTVGEVYIKDERIERFKTDEAIKRNVGMVHQHFKLVPSFTVTQNIVIGKEPRRLGVFFSRREAEDRVSALSHEYGLSVNPTDVVSNLSVGIQQRVEILKALYRGADILILDEPTAVLTPQETDELFDVLKRIVAEKNMTIIIITHKLYEVMEISDRVGVMRRGKLVAVKNTADVNERQLASLMVGREIDQSAASKGGEKGDVKIRTEELYVRDNRGLMAVNGISLEVRAGEILGIAAVEGNGQSELIEAIAGMRPAESGSVYLEGKKADGLTAGERRRLGLAHIPEDRIATGVSLESTIAENLIIGKEREADFAVKGLHLRKASIVRYAEDLFERFDLRGSGVDSKVGELSGGNMQKVVVAREFSFPATSLLVCQPTRGVDIGAIEFIHGQIEGKRNQGCAILLVSADLDEIFKLSDRIITVFEGRITGSFEAGNIDKAGIGYYMTGNRTDHKPQSGPEAADGDGEKERGGDI